MVKIELTEQMLKKVKDLLFQMLGNVDGYLDVFTMDCSSFLVVEEIPVLGCFLSCCGTWT